MTREADPTKRAHLFAIRSLIDVADKAIGQAAATAHEANIDPEPLRHAARHLRGLELLIVNRLRTN